MNDDKMEILFNNWQVLRMEMYHQRIIFIEEHKEEFKTREQLLNAVTKYINKKFKSDANKLNNLKNGLHGL